MVTHVSRAARASMNFGRSDIFSLIIVVSK